MPSYGLPACPLHAPSLLSLPAILVFPGAAQQVRRAKGAPSCCPGMASLRGVCTHLLQCLQVALLVCEGGVGGGGAPGGVVGARAHIGGGV